MIIDEDRRRFCIAGLAGISGVLGVSMFGGGALFLGAPGISNKLEGKWIEVGARTDFEEGLFSQVVLEFDVQDGWAYSSQKMLAYVKRDGDQLLALSATCTHLGCNVRWREESNQFVCPCHAGVYDENGKNLSGPPPKPLFRLPAKIEENVVLVYNKATEGDVDV
jgi:menaquinol-cytochrome c reductase iron-sulfur subunit